MLTFELIRVSLQAPNFISHALNKNGDLNTLLEF